MIKKSELKIVRTDDPVLLSSPNPFVFGGEIDAEMFSNLMIERMKELGGVGLSANQVGLNIKMFVMGAGDKFFSIFNPEVIETSIETVSEDEGCLSFPGLYLKVNRPSRVIARYRNAKGEEKIEEFSGLTARIFLHEYDHMEGKTFRDRVSKLKWDLAYNRMVKRTKKIIKRGVQKQLINLAKQIEDSDVNS